MNPYQISGTPVANTTVSVAIGAASAAVALGNDNDTCVRVVATADCFIEFGQTPVASPTNDMFLPAGIVEHFYLPLGANIAVIQSVGAGTLYATPMPRNYAAG